MGAAMGAVVLSAPSSGWAMAVVDAGTHELLGQILSELQTQTKILQQQQAKLEEIKEVNSQILSAICPASTVTMVGNTGFDSDQFNVSATPLQLMSPDMAQLGYTVPSPTDVQGLQSAIRNALGVAADFKSAVDNPDPARLGRMSLELVKRIQKSRAEAQADAVRKSLAYSTYSLNQGQAAKSRETTLDQGRRSAGCLREDVTALHETAIEQLRRMNHLIALMANDSAVNALDEVRKLPVKAPPPQAGDDVQGQGSDGQ